MVSNSRVKMPRQRATARRRTRYRNTGVREWRIMRGSRRRGSGNWRRNDGGWEGAVDWWQRVKRRIQWCPCPRATRSIRSFARSLASSIIIRPLCPPAISAALSPSTMSTWHSPSRSHILLVRPTVLSFNHKAHRRRTRSRGSSACPWMHLNRHPFCYPDARWLKAPGSLRSSDLLTRLAFY